MNFGILLLEVILPGDHKSRRGQVDFVEHQNHEFLQLFRDIFVQSWREMQSLKRQPKNKVMTCEIKLTKQLVPTYHPLLKKDIDFELAAQSGRSDRPDALAGCRMSAMSRTISDISTTLQSCLHVSRFNSR